MKIILRTHRSTRNNTMSMYRESWSSFWSEASYPLLFKSHCWSIGFKQCAVWYKRYDAISRYSDGFPEDA